MTVLLGALGLILLVPVGVLLVEVLAARVLRIGPRPSTAGRPSVAVIVPAHDEAAGIAHTVKAILGELRAGDRLLVVADNCSDDTFERARAAGAEAVRRDDPDRRGKGFALEFGVRHLAAAPCDVVIVMDADCEASEGSLGLIAELAMIHRRPVQAYYGMEQPAGATADKLPLAGLAWRVKNWVRPSGLHRLGLPCQLTGTGMAFPWPVIAKARLGSAELVEDLVLGLELARSGTPPLFCPDALVTSTFPANEEGQSSQRARWETGHINVILRELPGLWLHALRSRNMALMALVLDAAVPPLALLMLAISAYGIAAFMWYLAVGATFPIVVGLLAGTGLAIGIVVAAGKATGDLRAISDLAAAPAYALTKVGIYCGVLARRQLEWIRTKRD